nr:hypothetical protein [Tanacetum cinerariifolium]
MRNPVKILHKVLRELTINVVTGVKFDQFSFFKTPKVLLLAWDRVSEIKSAVGNKQYKPEDVQGLFCKLLNDVKNIHDELAECINIPSWNCPAFSSDDDDDENYIIPISPEEPYNSLSMGDEHLDTILATKSDEVIKSSVEDLVPILNSGTDRSFVSTAFSAFLDVAPSTLDTSYAYHTLIVCDEKVVCIPYGDEVLITQGDNCDGENLTPLLNILLGLRTRYDVQLTFAVAIVTMGYQHLIS